MTAAADEKFWRTTERAEENFTASCDVKWFRNRMIGLGHEPTTIRERVEAIHPHLLGDFDRLEYMAGQREAGR